MSAKRSICVIWVFDYDAQFTHFFRWLKDAIQKKIKIKDKTLLIRDFGCSSGEETHLIAMLVHRALEDFDKRADIQKLENWISSWDVKIIGYSFCPLALERAEEARFFTNHSKDCHDLAYHINVPHPFELLYRYAHLRHGSQSQISEDIADWLRFEWLDLFDLEDMKGLCSQKADAIICRRTLYFDQLESTMENNELNIERKYAKAALLTMLNGIYGSGLLITDRTGSGGMIEKSVTNEGFTPLGDTEQRKDGIVNSGVYRKIR